MPEPWQIGNEKSATGAGAVKACKPQTPSPLRGERVGVRGGFVVGVCDGQRRPLHPNPSTGGAGLRARLQTIFTFRCGPWAIIVRQDDRKNGFLPWLVAGIVASAVISSRLVEQTRGRRVCSDFPWFPRTYFKTCLRLHR